MKRVTLFVLSCLCVCFVATAQPLKRVAPEAVGMNGQLLKNADDILNQGIKDGKMPGAVLAVVRHGKMAYIKAYGNRRVKPTIDPMTTGTIFDMASCTKPLATGLSIMKLMEQGKLRLSDPVSDFIPGYKDWVNKDSTDRTTIRLRHVLTHTTGLPAYASVDYLQKKYGAPDPKGLLVKAAYKWNLLPLHDMVLAGLYVKPEFVYANFDYTDPEQTIVTTQHVNHWALLAEVGYQIIYKWFLFDFYTGLGPSNGDIATNNYYHSFMLFPSDGHLAFTAGFRIGVAF